MIRVINAEKMTQVTNEILRYILVTRTNREYDPGAILIDKNDNVKVEKDPICVEQMMDHGYVIMLDLDEFAVQLERELVNTINMRIGKMLGEFNYERSYHAQRGDEPI